MKKLLISFALTVIILIPAAAQGKSAVPPRTRTYDVLHYIMRLSFDRPAKVVKGDATVRLTPIDKPARSVELDAVDIKFDSVTLEGSDTDLTYKADGRKLTVDLGKTVEPGDVVELRFRYTATPKKGIYFVEPLEDEGKIVRAGQIWTQGEAEETQHWLPSYDFPDDKATTEQYITAEKGETVIGNGKLVERRSNPDGTQVFHFKMDVPHSLYLTSFVIGDYVRIEERYGDVPLGYYVYPGQEEVVPLAYGKTKKMFKAFEDLTGVKYPYNKYDQTMVANFPWGGMENITATTMADTEILFAKFKFGQPLVEDLVSHELAHSWFGNLVTCKNWSELWLNEGFATFMEAAFREKEYGRENYDAKILQDAMEAMAYEKLPGRTKHALFNKKADPEDDDSMFDTITYQKGGTVIHMLREEIGNEAFWKGVNIYLERFIRGNVESSDLKSVMEEVSKRDLKWFFDQWVYGQGFPEIKITHRYDAAKKELVIEAEQTQSVGSGVPEAFTFPLEIGFRTSSGTKLEKIVLDGRKQQFRIKTSGKPSDLKIDPSNKIPLKIVSLSASSSR